jgi:lysophospholipase L1-like esterase
VVLNGGINDLNQDCDCDECDDVLNSIVSEDGQTGDVPDLIDRATADGAQIVLVGYAELDPEARWGFGVCNDAADALETRYRHLAERRQDVVFVDPSDAMSLAGTPEAYTRDGVHPSEAGSALIGHLVVDAIQARAD